jgi:hypothetical protein
LAIKEIPSGLQIFNETLQFIHIINSNRLRTENKNGNPVTSTNGGGAGTTTASGISELPGWLLQEMKVLRYLSLPNHGIDLKGLENGFTSLQGTMGLGGDGSASGADALLKMEVLDLSGNPVGSDSDLQGGSGNGDSGDGGDSVKKVVGLLSQLKSLREL